MVGCGAGGVLSKLHEAIDESVNFYGFDIAPDAIDMASNKQKERLEFFFVKIFFQRGKILIFCYVLMFLNMLKIIMDF
jgi:SAM-dependent methyltransferase